MKSLRFPKGKALLTDSRLGAPRSETKSGSSRSDGSIPEFVDSRNVCKISLGYFTPYKKDKHQYRSEIFISSAQVETV